MRDSDAKLIRAIKNNEDLCNYLLCECDVIFVEHDILCENLKSLMVHSESNYSMEPFACDGSGGVFVFLNQTLIGYLDSEGQAGIIANNIQDFFSIILNCGYVSDWAKFGWLSDENIFINAYNELAIPRDNACVKRFIHENDLEYDPVKIYSIFKEAVSRKPQLTITATSDVYVDYEQMFDV